MLKDFFSLEFLPYDGPIFDCVIIDGANVLTKDSERTKNENGVFLLKKVDWKCSECGEEWKEKNVPFDKIKDEKKFDQTLFRPKTFLVEHFFARKNFQLKTNTL